MYLAHSDILPLVSVIIPCYNHGQYLSDAIISVQQSSYKNVEIIVVNDGSSDDTEKVASQFSNVVYIYQSNQGLSAARNAGLKKSRGDFLVFLDADDWLYVDGIQLNVERLLQFPNAAFVSGAHDKVTGDKEIIEEGISIADANHYIHFLRGNYVGMHATVMYRRNVFSHFLFDTTLKACEDYDLYLKVTRVFAVIHHQGKIAAYRFHYNNMSSNETMMLHWVLLVLKRQKKFLVSSSEKIAYKQGIRIWKEYYSELIFRKAIHSENYRLLKMVRNSGFLMYLKLILRRTLHDVTMKSKSRGHVE